MDAGRAALALVFSITPALTAAAAGTYDGGVPALTVRVSAVPAISPLTIDRMLEEASAIWQPAGVSFEWHRDERQPTFSIKVESIGPRVIIGDGRGMPSQSGAPLGWVTFTGDQPDGDIHLSHRNTERFILSSGPMARAAHRMTPAERVLLVGRALGRALAHELGHYLLRSKAHTTSGLMRGRRTVKEFVDAPRGSFGVDSADRDAVVRRIREITQA